LSRSAVSENCFRPSAARCTTRLTSLRVSTTWSEAAFCCWVASEISRATCAASLEEERSSSIDAAAAWAQVRTPVASWMPDSVATTVPRIEPANSSSRLRTDSTDSLRALRRAPDLLATTEKRRPCSPPLPASMAALSDRMWVSWAISVVRSRTR
jgi:hypothetical protein